MEDTMSEYKKELRQYRELTDAERMELRREFLETTYQKSMMKQSILLIVMGMLFIVPAIVFGTMLMSGNTFEGIEFLGITFALVGVFMLSCGYTIQAMGRNNYALWLRLEKNINMTPVFFNTGLKQAKQRGY